MATKVSICSNALLMLGANPINSLSENSDRARLAANLYDPARDYVLRSHPWNCAVKRVLLAADVEVPAFDYGAQFTLPSDWLRTLQVGAEGYELDYKTESGKILCNGTSLPLRYIWRNDNEATWDAGLVWAMTCGMRALFAYPITASASMEQLLDKALEPILKTARAVDGQDDPPQTFGDTPLLNARLGGRGRY
jgi:hypothetical protein